MPAARIMRATLAALVALTPVLASPPAQAATEAATGAEVVLIGTGGVRWSDIGDNTTTPNLYALLRDGASGLMADRSVRSWTCPVDGWLAVSAGRRAAEVSSKVKPKPARTCSEPSLTVTDPGGATAVPKWSTYRAAAATESFDAEPGLLGDTLAKSGRTAAAVGPGAAIGLATSAGRVAHAWAGGASAGGVVDTDRLGDDVQAALATDPDVLAVDVGVVRDAGTTPGVNYGRGRPDQVRDVDTRIGMVISQVQAAEPDATIVVASLADSGYSSRLQLVGALGPASSGGAFTGSLLGSRSTRQDGLVQETDLLPTLLAAVGVPEPLTAVGSPLTPVERGGDAGDRLQALTDLDTASRAVTPIVPIFFNGLVVAQILLYGTVALMLRRRGRAGSDDPAAGPARRRMLGWMRRGAVVFAAVPAATFLAQLVPWWRSSHPGWAVTGAVVLFTVPIALVALLGPWRRTLLGPVGAVGGATALVLGVDACTGSHLALSSLMGVQPVVAGRFYGFGNVAFALFATGALLLGLAVADPLLEQGRRRAAVLSVAGIGLVAVIVDATPGLGSDFGGPPALIPAFAVLGLLIGGVKLTWRRLLLIAGATVAFLVLICFADWLRPPADRTHLGRFMQTVIDGGVWDVVSRKASQNIGILFGSWLSALIPFAVAFVVLVLTRPVSWGARPLQVAYDRSRVLRHGMAAFGVMVFLGFALNDSGTVVPAISATVALPGLIAVSARALQLDDEERLDAALRDVRKKR
ncbi:hypothetical protein ACIB24_03405 [Spongisporangium articulatum]|uniref:Alkaline phosphatase n=1 Tax=Spongisporangium articulatum TaxID=3362603 RepID=A0ABW8AIB5_9ACTN